MSVSAREVLGKQKPTTWKHGAQRRWFGRDGTEKGVCSVLHGRHGHVSLPRGVPIRHCHDHRLREPID